MVSSTSPDTVLISYPLIPVRPREHSISDERMVPFWILRRSVHWSKQNVALLWGTEHYSPLSSIIHTSNCYWYCSDQWILRTKRFSLKFRDAVFWSCPRDETNKSVDHTNGAQRGDPTPNLDIEILMLWTSMHLFIWTHNWLWFFFLNYNQRGKLFPLAISNFQHLHQPRCHVVPRCWMIILAQWWLRFTVGN